MRAPQIIMIVIMAMGLGINLTKHGEPKEDNYSFPIALLATAIQAGLLIWGGFF